MNIFVTDNCPSQSARNLPDKHVAEWLDECPVKWNDNDVIDGALWIIVHNAIEPEEEEEE